MAEGAATSEGEGPHQPLSTHRFGDTMRRRHVNCALVSRAYVHNMRTIGIRELKAHLSQVLRDVQAGETVLVTDRGHVVAEMRLPDDGTKGESRVDRAIARLASSGDLRVAARAREPYRASPIRSAVGTAASMLDADRADV